MCLCVCSGVSNFHIDFRRFNLSYMPGTVFLVLLSRDRPDNVVILPLQLWVEGGGMFLKFDFLFPLLSCRDLGGSRTYDLHILCIIFSFHSLIIAQFGNKLHDLVEC